MESAFIDQLWHRSTMGVSYLTHNTNQDGSFNYCIDAMTGSLANDYNILRHAGTVFELCEWVHATQDYSVLISIRKALSYLQKHLEPWGPLLCIVENDEVKLGGATLTLLALCSYYRLTGDPAYVRPMSQLADFILTMQSQEGNFHARLCYSQQRLTSLRSRLYAGQALFALMSYFSIGGERKYLLAARRYICFEMFSVRNPGSSHAWLAKGLMAFYEKEPSHAVLSSICNIGINAIKILYRNSSQFLSNAVPDNGTTTAKAVSIAEALVPYLKICLLCEENEQMINVTNALRNSLGICFENQIIEDRYIDGYNLFGGLINSKTDHRIRIDFVQHFLSSASSLMMLSSYQQPTPNSYGPPQLG